MLKSLINLLSIAFAGSAATAVALSSARLKALADIAKTCTCIAQLYDFITKLATYLIEFMYSLFGVTPLTLNLLLSFQTSCALPMKFRNYKLLRFRTQYPTMSMYAIAFKHVLTTHLNYRFTYIALEPPLT